MQTTNSMPPPRPRQASSRMLDGVHRAVPEPRRFSPRPLPLTGARFTKLKTVPKKRRAHAMLIAICASPVLLVLSATGVVGMAVAALYGVVAIVAKLSSRVTFVLALAAFIYMFSLQVAGMAVWAQTEAVIAYILLTVGAVALALETRRSRVVWSKKQ